MNTIRRVLAISLAMSLGSAVAQVYKCKDASGRTVYSDSLCAFGAKPLDEQTLRANTLEIDRPHPPPTYQRPSPGGSPDGGRPPPLGQLPSGSAGGGTCPTALQIRNMETSANSITNSAKERAFLQAEVARARACRQGSSTYSQESWRALEDAQRQQNRVSNAERAAARRTAEELHLSNGSTGVQQGILQDRANEAARRQARGTVLTNCDPAGCWDSGGRRYNRAAGGTFFRDDGTACHQSGTQLQCH